MILRTLGLPQDHGFDAGVSLVGVSLDCEFSPTISEFQLNLANHLSASAYDPSQPRGLVECTTDFESIAGLYAAMERIIIQNLLRCPGASEDVDVCNSSPWIWDCNGNGIPDCIDILTRFSLDLDENDIPDECEDGSLGPCPADLTGDFGVNLEDLLILLNSWGSCPQCPADLDGSGTVDFNDLVMMLGAWGACYFDDGTGLCTQSNTARYEILPPQSIADCIARYGLNTQQLIACIEAMILAGTP